MFLVIAMVITGTGFTTLANSLDEEKENDLKIVEELKNEFGEEKAEEILGASKNDDKKNEVLEDIKKVDKNIIENNDIEKDGIDNVNNKVEKFNVDNDETEKLVNENSVKNNIEDNNQDNATKNEEENNKNQISENLETDGKKGNIDDSSISEEIVEPQNDEEEDVVEDELYEEEPEEDTDNNSISDFDDEKLEEDEDESNEEIVNSEDNDDENLDDESKNICDEEEIVNEKNNENDIENNLNDEEELKDDLSAVDNNYENELNDSDKNIYEEEINDKKSIENDAEIEKDQPKEENDIEKNDKDYDNEIEEEKINNEEFDDEVVDDKYKENEKKLEKIEYDDTNNVEELNNNEGNNDNANKDINNIDIIKNNIASNSNIESDDEELIDEVLISQIKLPSLNTANPNEVYYYIDSDTLHFSNNASNPGASEVDLSIPSKPWSSQSSSITAVEFDNEIQPTTTAYLFFGLSSLIEIRNFSKLDTSSVTDMNNMFKDCSLLTSLNLSSFDTSSVIDMNNMFSGCSSLTSINLTSFDTTNVTKMDLMFDLCCSLQSLDLTNFDTSKVTSMHRMFCHCDVINVLDLTSFKTTYVTEMGYMFGFCNSLKTIIVSDNFVTEQVISSDEMFFDCDNIRGGCGTTHDALKVDKTYARIDVEGTPGYFTSKDCIFWYIVGDELHLAGLEPTASEYKTNGGAFDDSIGTVHRQPWALYVTSIKKVVIDNEIHPTITAFWFENLTELVEIQNLSKLNTSNVVDMDNMFCNCNKLTNLDLSSFDTSSVIKMYSMFRGCSSLISLDLTNFDTSNVNSMYAMFVYCSSLTSLDLTSFDTSNVYAMDDMFQECSSLISLDLTSFDTSNVIMMSYMFSDCNSLRSIIVSDGFDTPVSDCIDMFLNCNSIVGGNGTTYDSLNVDRTYARIDVVGTPGYFTSKDCIYWYVVGDILHLAGLEPTAPEYITNGGAFDSINFINGHPWESYITSIRKVVIDNEIHPTKTAYLFAGLTELIEIQNLSKLNTSNVVDMNSMFFNCNKLTNLDLSSFDTVNVINMKAMFYNCSSLISLDIISFVILKVENMEEMFLGCSLLTTLDLTSFDTSNVSNMNSMFKCCSSLTALDLTSFDTSNVSNMNSMFKGCSSLTAFDLRNFNTSNVENTGSMFESCSLLKTIYVLDGFDTSNVSNSLNMFLNCSSIVGANGTVYDSSKVDKIYARPDLEGEPGYFTKCTYTIKFNAMGGVVSKESIRKIYGINITLDTPIRENYIFKGWFTDSDCTLGNEYDGTTDISIVHNDIVFIYAKWINNIYKITLDDMGATTKGTQELYEKYNEGIYNENSCSSLVTSIIVPKKTNYTFSGYYDNSFIIQYIKIDGSINSFNFKNTTFTSDIRLYAKWNKISNGNGGGGGGGGGGLSKAPKISYEPLKTNAKLGILRLQDVVVNLDNYEWIQNTTDNTWSLNIDKKGLVASALNKVYDENYKLLAKNSFCNIEGSIYYFDENEKMTTGWLKNELGEMYLFEWQKNADEGKMVKGWKFLNGNWYYFREDGRLLTYSFTPDGYFVDSAGVYIADSQISANMAENQRIIENDVGKIETLGPQY